MTATSPVWGDDTGNDIGDPMLFPDSLESEYRSEGRPLRVAHEPVDASGGGRPLRPRPDRPAAGEHPLANPAGQPAENTGDYAAGSQRRSRSRCGVRPTVDNGRMTVHIQWANPDTDWDLYIIDSAGEVVTPSASFGDTNEDAVLFDPPPGEYTAHVVELRPGGRRSRTTTGRAARSDFRSPTARDVGPKEAWQPDLRGRGRAACARHAAVIVVDRGERVERRQLVRGPLGGLRRPSGRD